MTISSYRAAIHVHAGSFYPPANRAVKRQEGPMQEAAVSVVVPAIDEARNLPYVLPLIPSWVHEVILVDGGSTDGTPDVARALWPGIRIVEQPRRGKGAALQYGFRLATG